MTKATRRGAKAPAPAGYRRLLRWAALPVTDRRWAAPLSAVALGFGLFVGVAIGPGAAGTFATGAAQIIEIPGFGGGTETGSSDEGGGGPSIASSAGSSGGGGGATSSEPTFSSLPSGESESEFAPGPESTPGSGKSEPAEKEEEAEPEKQTLAGIVLHVNPAAGSYTLAEPGGTLDVLHAGKPPRPGTKVSVPVRLLANGTFAEAGKRSKTGSRGRAAFSGIVTYVDPTATAPAYTVSKRGASLLVHVHPDPSGAPPVLPALGTFARVGVDIERTQPASTSESPLPVGEIPTPDSSSSPPVTATVPAEQLSTPAPECAPDPSQPPLAEAQPDAVLWQRQVSAQGAPFTSSDFAGIVEAVCADTGKLLVSADDIRESGHDLVFAMSPEIDVTKLQVGQSILAMATIGADGSLGLTGLASDERLKGADDAKAAQGELVPSKPK